VPDIGDCIKLSKDWIFYMQKEYRNKLDLDQFGTGKKMEKDSIQFYKDHDSFNEVLIPKNSILKVDRIYIRKGAVGFSSITFILSNISGKKIKSQRFWAPLRECNKIEFEFDKELKNIKIQWPFNYIFKGKESMPRSINGVEGIFNTTHNYHYQFNNIHNHDVVGHRYSKPVTLEGQIDGEKLLYHIRDNVQTRLLNEEEKELVRESGHFKNIYVEGFLNKNEKRNEILDTYMKISDWDLEIVNEKGEVVKTYKSLTSAKNWIKQELSK